MSFSKQKKEQIKEFILEKISYNENDFVAKACEAFDTTKQTVYRYVRELQESGMLEKKDSKYQLVNATQIITIDLNQQALSEETIYTKYIDPATNTLSNNVYRMWYYCFTEMFNNCIDHSGATNVNIYIEKNPIYTQIIISDNGIGIFRKIKDYFHYDSIDDAIVELFKGKLTTDKVHHSGEGIFFSSRIMDLFIAVSDNRYFSHTEFSDNIIDMSKLTSIDDSIWDNGTTILMRLSNHSRKTAKEIFDMYADGDGGFTKTSIPIKNIFPNDPVSRSQAKRLVNRLENFQEVELDFSDVEEIGQGFAHELFVVFKNEHPEVEIIPYNVNLDVQRMINHVLR